MTAAVPTKVNGIWPVSLLPHRVEFHDKRPRWERDRLVSCADRIESGMVVYDLGAEEGDFTALYRTWVGDSGQVVPVEPSPPYWPAIRKTWEGNGFAPPKAWFAGFVSDVTDLAPPQDGMARKRLPGRGRADSAWPVCSVGPVIPDFGFRHLAQQADSTPQITLTDLAERTGLVPDAIVMDIEGSEHRALVGAAELLTQHDVLVWASLHPVPMAEWYGVTVDDVHELMRSYGYEGTYLGEEIELFFVYERRR